MGVKSRKKAGISGNKILGILLGGVIIGGVAVYFLPQVAPQVYSQLDKATGGTLTTINNGIHSGLSMIGIK